MPCFGYLCINVLVLYVMSIIFGGGGGGGVASQWWGGIICTGFYGLSSFPVRGRFCNLGLGIGGYMPG